MRTVYLALLGLAVPAMSWACSVDEMFWCVTTWLLRLLVKESGGDWTWF